MAMRAIESDPMVNSGTHPEALFRDENLTVYGLHLTANTDTDVEEIHDNPTDDCPDTTTGKRRRAPSPDSQSKRTRLEDESPATSIREQMKQSKFSPTSLSGLAAHEWRKLVIEAMFPASRRAVNTANHPQTKNNKTDTSQMEITTPPGDHPAIDPTEEEPHFTYSRGLPHRDLKLPVFERESPPDTLCYICVGPRVRGRFHADKAKALQIPRGPLMGKLTKGETITFTVDDGKGGKVERTVKPEDCVDPPEASKVVHHR